MAMPATSGPMAVITPMKRNKLWYRARCSDQRVEVDFLSRASAEEALMESSPGSVVVFVHTEPSEAPKGSTCSTSSSSSRRHSLYVSFRYRRTVIHYENNWIQLKELYREGLRRPVFYAEPKQFEKMQALVSSFVPRLRSWLEAIVKAANFMDKDAMAVDLQELLRVQNHAIVTRRSLQQVGVMLCKLQDAKRLTSVGIVFNFEELKVHDDDKNALENFQDVFQQFIGLHPGLQLEPIEQGDLPLSMHLLEGLDEDAPLELRRQKLLRLQRALKSEKQPGSAEVLELGTTLLLPQLLHSKALSGEACNEAGFGQNAGHLSVLGEAEVLLCDILSDLCDLHHEHVVPHLWRLLRAYLEDPAHWHPCLLALALLTTLSSKLSEQLLHTDAALCLFDVLAEVQKQLTCQREEVLAATGRMNRLQLPSASSSRSRHQDWTPPRPEEEPSPESMQELLEGDHPLSVPEMSRSEPSSGRTAASLPRSVSDTEPWHSMRDLAAPLRWPMQAMQGSLEPRASRPSVPPLNLDAAKLVASPDAPSTTQRLKTQSSRLSRRLKMEAQRVVPGCFFGSCAASSPSGNPNDVFAETGRFTVTPFVGLKRPLPQPARSAAGRAPAQACDLAKTLGESALLADLGPLLRMKQEKAVQEAVAKRSVSGSASGSEAQTTASAKRVASQDSLLSAYTATPREGVAGSRAPLRRIRLHCCLVLEGLCRAVAPGSPALFEVPVSHIFEMLQASCSRAGACSFALDEELAQAPRLAEAAPASPPLAPEPLDARLAGLDRLRSLRLSAQCVCGADHGRLNDACSPCTCLDDATAACLWQLLAENSRQVEIKLKAVPATAEDLGKWPWQKRLGLDGFLLLLASCLGHTLSQLKAAQRTGTAGPDVTMSLQNRVSATLRFGARYLRERRSAPSLALAQQVLSTPLVALKAYLAASVADLERQGGGKPQGGAALRLWAAYLELAGILLRGALKSGRAGGQLGHLLVVLLLDFPVLCQKSSLSSRPAESLHFKGLPTKPEASSPSLRGFFSLCSAPRIAPKPSPPPAKASSFWECLPRIFELVLKQGDLGDSHTNKCLLLAFLEALLDFAHAISSSKADQSSRQVGVSLPLSPGIAEAMLQKLFEWLQFLFLPPSGLLCRLGALVSSPTLLKRLVSCEKALFSVPDVGNSIFARKYSVLEYYVRRHFLAFVALYNRQNPADEAQCNAACRLHVETLLAMAGITMEDNLPRRAFLQQSVLDFFVGEIELEHVTQQMHLSFMRRHTASSLVRAASMAEPKLPPATAPERAVSAPAPDSRPKRAFVPSLCLGGLPASLQGCSGLGAAPPEEVTRLDPVGLAAAAVVEASPSPPADRPASPASDSSDEEFDTPQETVPELPASEKPALPPILPKAIAKVPSLSFLGLRPSLQGCSGLGAAPPEEPGISPVEAEPFLPSGQFETLEGPDSSDEEDAEVPVPAQRAVEEPDSSDEELAVEAPVEAPLRAAARVPLAVPLLRAQVPPIAAPPAPIPAGLPQLAPVTLAAPPAPATQELDSSDEEAEAPPLALPGSAQACLSERASPSPDQELDSSDEDAEVGASTWPCAPLSKPAPVPKLSFMGVRSSLQGSAFMGMPPPEEPGQPEEPPEMSVDRASRGSGPSPSGPPRVETREVHDLCAGVIHQNVFYFEGRQRRRIYQDLELHASILTLILMLLLSPRGLLDSNYCDPYPARQHRRNIPFLLSKHLNHSANRAVLPWVFQQVDQLGRAELRLLKLLVESAMHRWMYTNMRMIGAGQFGTVMQSSVSVGCQSQPQVAIKQIPQQKNIQDHCVFVDVFTEISCLDTVRFEDHLCHIYDFGVEESCYWIVMKYYTTTLKKWRASLGQMKDHLPVLLAVFKQVLKGLAVLHQHDIIHYDLKCDNIMVEVTPRSAWSPQSTAASPSEDSGLEVPKVALGDFGESRIMENSQELDMRNRGTEIIKGPEMLELEVVSRRDSKVHDRRKRVGTNKAADIWSLGCLFFELLTGRFLFQDYDIASHWACATGKSGDVINEENEQRLDKNPLLLEYLRFLLVRDADRRPTIQMASKKFEMAAAVLGQSIAKPGSPQAEQSDTPRSIAPSLGSNSSAGARLRQTFPPDRPLTCAVEDGQSYFAKVLSNLCILEVSDEELLNGLGDLKRSLLGLHAWTHVVDFRWTDSQKTQPILQDAELLTLPWTSNERPALEFLDFLPAIFDFLRLAAVSQGMVLFVDGDAKAGEPGCLKGSARGGLAIGAVLALVAESYRLAIFSALSYVSSQLLMALRPDVVRALASCQEDLRFSAWARCKNSAYVSCFCGACHWYIPKAWLESNAQASCTGSGHCPHPGGCAAYVAWLRKRYAYQSLRWIWVPKGATLTEYNGAPFDDGTVARPMSEQVELMEPMQGPPSRCFRCKTCKVMTYAEVEGPEARQVLVSYGLQAEPQGADDIPTEAEASPSPSTRQRPPPRLSKVPLAEVLWPQAQWLPS